MSAAPATITFLSDYGVADEYAGVCHAVIARRCPPARVIDLTHGIPPGDVRAGAIVLRGALPYAPAGVHLAVVDPGVGGPRRAVALRTGARAGGEQRLLVGPDNGLLMPAAARFGGASEAVALEASSERLQPASPTFHGRDIFAPVAAALACGAALQDVGEPLDPALLIGLDLPEAHRAAGGLVAHALHHDRFGNVMLDATPAQLDELAIDEGAEVAVFVGDAGHRACRAAAFSQVARGEMVLYVDGLGLVALAVNGGSARAQLGIDNGDELRIAPGTGT